ncbi:MAG: hypothetical protein ACLFU8_11760 [Anaerolineales bacterium]
MAPVALFAGLVIDEQDRVAQVTYVGGDAFYVVDDDGFDRHIPAEVVDRQVLRGMKEQILDQRELVVQGMLQYLGQDDLFTKATVETSIDQLDEHLEELQRTGLPEEARSWLGLMGFRIVIDVHGEIVDLQMPEAAAPEE